MTNPKLEVLTPQNSQLIFIDQQPQMAFGVQSIDRQVLKNNVVALAKAAKVFKIPTTITSVESASFSGYTYPELLDVFPDQPILERTSMNSWDDKKVRDALKANKNRPKVIVSGLWTEVCNITFAVSAMLEGDYEIYMVADASGGTSKEAHDYAMQRMIQAGVVPVTWQPVMLEWQRDWARRDTYDAVMAIVREHSGAYGVGVDYAYAMVHKAPQRTGQIHLIKDVLNAEQKKQVIQKLTDAIVSIAGENLRGATWVKIYEVNSGEWGIGGKPLTTEAVKELAAGRQAA